MSHAGMATNNGKFHDTLIKIVPELVRERISQHLTNVNKTLVLSKRRAFMKHAVTPEYVTAVAKFGLILSELKNKVLLEMHHGQPKSAFLSFYDINNRKFDRIYLVEVAPGLPCEPELQFFIDPSNGSIYGKKSDVSPNLTYYYGTVYNCDKWNWELDPPMPVNDPSVTENTEVRQYGRYSKRWIPTPQNNQA